MEEEEGRGRKRGRTEGQKDRRTEGTEKMGGAI